MRHLFIGPDIYPTRDMPCNYPLWHLLSLKPPDPIHIISTSIRCPISRTFRDFGRNHPYLAKDLESCYMETEGHFIMVGNNSRLAQEGNKNWANFLVLRAKKKNKIKHINRSVVCGSESAWVSGIFLFSGFHKNREFYGQLNNCNIFKNCCVPYNQLFNDGELLLRRKC